jgi:carbon storage regulator
MVTISRGKNEAIVINDSVIVTVIEITEDQVRLAIEHPDDTAVRRGETLAALERSACENSDCWGH